MKKSLKEFKKEHLTKTPPADCKLQVGDKVEWTNDAGIKWTNKVIGFNTENWYNKEFNKFVHLDTGSYWFPHSEESLTKII